MASQSKEPDYALIDHVRSTQFRVYNRLVATKPLEFLVNLLNLGGDIAAGARPPAASKPSGKADDDESTAAYLNISTATNRGVLGIRLGSYFEADQYAFVLDSAVEYRFDRNLFAFRDDEVETFVRTVAAPRIAIATWTLLEEAAATVQYRLPGQMAIPPEAITDSVMKTYLARARSKETSGPSAE